MIRDLRFKFDDEGLYALWYLAQRAQTANATPGMDKRPTESYILSLEYFGL